MAIPMPRIFTIMNFDLINKMGNEVTYNCTNSRSLAGININFRIFRLQLVNYSKRKFI